MACQNTHDRAVCPSYPTIIYTLDGSDICAYVSLNDDNTNPVVFTKSYPNTTSDEDIAADLLSEIQSRVSADEQEAFRRGHSISKILQTSLHSPFVESGLVVYSNSADVNAKSTGNTLIVTLPAAKVFHPFLVNFEVVEAVGVITPALLNIGTNAGNYNNVVSLYALGSLVGTSGVIASNWSAINPSDNLYVRVATAGVATGNLKFRVRVLGYTGEV